MIELTVEQRKELIEKYPYLMPKHPFTNVPIPNYDYSFIEGEYNLPEGWFELFLQCCEDIGKVLKEIDYLDRFYFVQIKEKWGKMRIFSHGATRAIQDIIHKYEFLSEQVCSICGKPATVMTYGHVCPYCSVCVLKTGEYVDDAEPVKIKTVFYKGTVEELDCTEEWNRYLERIGYKDENGSI